MIEAFLAAALLLTLSAVLAVISCVNATERLVELRDNDPYAYPIVFYERFSLAFLLPGMAVIALVWCIVTRRIQPMTKNVLAFAKAIFRRGAR